MIAFVPRPARPRSRVPDRRRGPAARRQRARGGAAGSSSRATSRTARSRALRPEIAVVTNVELDHHSDVRARWPRSRRCSTTGSRTCRTSCAAEELEPVDVRARRAGRAQPAERRLRARGARARGRRPRRGGGRALAEFRGAGRRFELARRGGRRARRRRLRAPSAESRRRRGRARARAGRVLVALPAAPLLAHAAPRARVRPRARGGGRRRGHRHLRGARGAGRRASAGKLVVDALAERAPGMRGRAGRRRVDDGARWLAARARGRATSC